jgi:hypothetical protein
VGVTLGVRELREPGTTWPVVLDSWDLPQISPRSMVNDMVNGSNKFGDTVRYCQTVKFVGLYTNVQKKHHFVMKHPLKWSQRSRICLLKSWCSGCVILGGRD